MPILRVGTSMEFDARFHVGDDKDFHQSHETIIKKGGDQKISSSGVSLHGPSMVSGGSGSGSPGKICVALKFLVGEAGQVRKDQSNLFKHIVEVRRLGFPNVIMPGDVR